MFDILILNVSSDKEGFFKEAIDNYLKRLSPYCRIKIETIKGESFRSLSDKLKIKKKETAKILSMINAYPEAEKILLTESGKEYDSQSFSEFLQLNSNKKIIFIIFGPLGPDKDLIKNFNTMSLSSLTFPHQLVKLILLEQIFRGVCILKGKDYHY
jgi:23S rRNA (pseudouridine1915-N3)-methyltransferase